VTQFLRAKRPSCNPTNSVKALKGTQSTDSSQWSGIILIHYQTPDGRGVAAFILALQHQYQGKTEQKKTENKKIFINCNSLIQ